MSKSKKNDEKDKIVKKIKKEKGGGDSTPVNTNSPGSTEQLIRKFQGANTKKPQAAKQAPAGANADAIAVINTLVDNKNPEVNEYQNYEIRICSKISEILKYNRIISS